MGGTFAGLDQFGGKGFGYRLVYPVLMLVAPLVWWRLHRGRDVPVPWGAFALFIGPDSRRRHRQHTRPQRPRRHELGLLIAPAFHGSRWTLALLLAIGWELGEGYTFIRGGAELDGATRTP